MDSNQSSAKRDEYKESLAEFSAKANVFLKKNWQELSRFCFKNQAVLFSLLLTFVTLCYFTITAYSGVFLNRFPGFSIRLAGIICIALMAIVSMLASWLSTVELKNKFFLWAQSLVLTIYSFSYFLSIENKTFYPVVFIFLSVLIFLVNLNLFTQQKFYLYLTVAQVFLYSLQTFSLINFFDIDRIAAREFKQDLLSLVFGLPDIMWIVLTSLAVTLTSIAALKPATRFKTWFFSGILFLLTFQVFWLTQNLSFNSFLYWQKTLVFLIVWDFLLMPLISISQEEKDDRYNARLTVSTAYHGILLALVILYTLL